MRRLSALDHMLQNFQHNWETNPQFRAMWSGGLGLAIVVFLCACLGFAFTVSSAIAANYTSGSTASNNLNVAPDGTVKSGSADSTISFPTETVSPWPAPQIPDGPLIPPSTTPQPSPTALPTATPLPTQPAGTGGGGGGGCKNCSVTVTSYVMVSGAPFTVTVHTSSPNDSVNIFVKSWPGGGSSPQNQGTTDANGDGVITLTGAPNPCSGTVSLWIVTKLSGSGSYSATCS